MEIAMLNLRNLFDQVMRHAEILNEGNEYQYIQLAKNFEEFRKKWKKINQEVAMYKDLLIKTESERNSLEMKLHHTRNLVDVEIKRRQQAEANCEKLELQLQLIRELVMCDSSGNVQLNEEQKSALGFLNRPQTFTGGSKRLSTIDESGSSQSDTSVDKTDESLDWDSAVAKAVQLKKSEKRENESVIAKTTLMVPNDGSPIEAISTIETTPFAAGRAGTQALAQPWKSDASLGRRKPDGQSETEFSTPGSTRMRPHEYVPKLVIKPEVCVPCGMQMKLGKLSLKCRVCQAVTHPECRAHCPLPCTPTLAGPQVRIGRGANTRNLTYRAPMILTVVALCVNEVEQRGLHERDLYRMSGCDRTVKELKEKFFRGKTMPPLSKVNDIHAVCGFLKDFLCALREPLLTFRFNRIFMAAVEIPDGNDCMVAMFQTVERLPQVNRDTLAFLMMHFQRVAQNIETNMDVANLARVFGPIIVGHTVADPDPMTLLQETRLQPKVVERLISLPVEYWRQFIMVQSENVQPTCITENSSAYSTSSTPDAKERMLGPHTTQEQQLATPPSSSFMSQNVGPTFIKSTPKSTNKSKSATSLGCQGNVLASPVLK